MGALSILPLGVAVGLNRPPLRIAVVSNTAWYLFNFRFNLLHELKAAGHHVIAVAPTDEYAERLVAAGIDFEAVNISGRGTNPVSELRSLYELRQIFRRRRVSLVLSYTPKGNLYSALNCAVLGVPFIPNVSGLGWAFINRTMVTFVVHGLYRLTFRRAHHVFFQNNDDMALFTRHGWIDPRKAERIPGSGVDLKRFAPVPLRDAAHDSPCFLMVARLLWDKGVGEYVEAARKVRAVSPKARFKLLGFLAPGNPSAIPQQQLDAWLREGAITYEGATSDVRPHLQEADCVVLPSYREGLPRVLLEAAAMARAVITTDAPGCRDAVVDGETGYACKVRDAEDLSRKMFQFIGLTIEDRHEMGKRGRKFVEEYFDERIVLKRYLEVIDLAVS